MDKKQFRTLTTVLVLASCLCSGCGQGPQKPKGFPEVFSCKITIKQGDSPLEGALVVLFPKSGVGNGWNTDGLTNAKGVAELKTHVDFKGAPAGDYVVMVTKTELSPGDAPDIAPTDPVEYEKWHLIKIAEKRIRYNLVKPEFGDMKKTPHTITITKGKNEATFDVGEPIKEEIK